MGIKIIPLVLIFIGILGRFLPHPPNFAPISALALFGGVYLPKKYAFIIPLAALFLSDYFIGFYGSTMFFVYGSFILTGLIGLWIRYKKSYATIFVGTLLSSIIFFIITNFGVWIDPASFYPKDFQGLLQSYYMAIPFFRNTILGDLFYTGVLFGVYELGFKWSRQHVPIKILKIVF